MWGAMLQLNAIFALLRYWNSNSLKIRVTWTLSLKPSNTWRNTAARVGLDLDSLALWAMVLYFGHGFGPNPIKNVFEYRNSESLDLFLLLFLRRTDPATRVRSISWMRPLAANAVWTSLRLRVQNKTCKLKVEVIQRRREILSHTAVSNFMQWSRTFSDRLSADTTDLLKQQHHDNGYAKYALVLCH